MINTLKKFDQQIEADYFVLIPLICISNEQWQN